jgi:hypothetical protein
MSRGCTPALDTPTQGLANVLVVLLGHGAAVGVCGPASLWTSVAGTARAGEKAHARAWWIVCWLASRMGATRPHAPRRSLRSGVGRAVFY